MLFHRVANTLNYLDIRTVVVSCGTCYDQLQDYRFDEIFPGSRIVDIHEFLLEKGVRLEGVTGTRYMYHDPCHSPIKTARPAERGQRADERRADGRIEKNDRCCGESGTFAISRPDIATQVRFRKQQEMERGAARLREDGFKGEVKVLTSCPSCLQGLKRYDDDSATDADYIVVEIARHVLGDGLARGLRAARERRRHRARAGLTAARRDQNPAVKPSSASPWKNVLPDDLIRQLALPPVPTQRNCVSESTKVR